MSNPESLAGDWFERVDSDVEPDAHIRYRNRHTTYISSDDEIPMPKKPPPKPRQKHQRSQQSTSGTQQGPPPQTLSLLEQACQLAENVASETFSSLSAKILKKFPHPDEKIRKTIKELKTAADGKALTQWRILIHMYHPDKNGSQSEEWRQIAIELSKAISQCRPKS
ncbi:hypothetical protein VKT23_016766 [Stygiomarasmius scandens]|uniref:J domain-containing protein n=1 Tax=Marasmiellus scandens TaxID=2682957 RepID=A0ABR1IY18_9AGAR